MRKHKIKVHIFCMCMACMVCAAGLMGCQNKSQDPDTDSHVSEKGEIDDNKQNDQNNDINHDDQKGDGEIDDVQQLEGFVGEDRYEQDFTKPEVDLNIYVDLDGYEPDDTKRAYFIGDNLADQFYVYEKQQNKLVYTGNLKSIGKDSQTGKSIAKGDFSTVTKPGDYYIQTAIIGRSYTFSITDNRYEHQFLYLQQKLLEKTPEEYYSVKQLKDNMSTIMEAFTNLTLTCEMQGQKMDENVKTQLRKHAEWLITQYDSGKDTSYTPEELFSFAAGMGEFSTVCQTDDPVLASNCLKQAQKAYQDAILIVKATDNGNTSDTKSSDDSILDWKYMAAAALYKASGYSNYHTVIKEYFASGSEKGVNEKLNNSTRWNAQRFWGGVFYMTSLKNVDMDICSEQMNELLKACGKMSDQASGNVFGLTGDTKRSQDIEIAQSAIELATADSIIVSREYRDTCKEQVHYLLHYTETEDMDCRLQSALFFIMGNLAESEDIE